MRLDRRQRARTDLALRSRRRRLATISRPAISSPMPAISPRSRWSPARSAPSTARSPPSARMRGARTISRIRPIAVCFRSRRRPASMPACAEAGILGALPGMLGSMMALEVIREIVGFGEGLVGRLLMIDARSMRFETLQLCLGSRTIRCPARSRRSGSVDPRARVTRTRDHAWSSWRPSPRPSSPTICRRRVEYEAIAGRRSRSLLPRPCRSLPSPPSRCRRLWSPVLPSWFARRLAVRREHHGVRRCGSSSCDERLAVEEGRLDGICRSSACDCAGDNRCRSTKAASGNGISARTGTSCTTGYDRV